MPEWLLDTSVFYWASSPEKKARIRSHGARLTTSASSLLEILAGMRDDTDFLKRRRAMCSALELCGADGILKPDTDTVVSAAFGVSVVPFPLEDLIYCSGLVVSATTLAELRAGMRDTVRERIARIDVEGLRTWDDEQGEYFKESMDHVYRLADPQLVARCEEMGLSGKTAKTLARELDAMK